MENFELYIDASPKINYLNGQFLKGHKPFNKGIPMSEWMDGRKKRKVLKCLEIGRKLGNKNLPGLNRKQIVGIKEGKLIPFDSASTAAKILKSKGVKINSRNICSVCNEKVQRFGKYQYIRKRAGGYQWFFADDINKYKMLMII